MKHFSLVVLVLLLAASVLAPSTAQAQLRNVTFVVNAATIPDTAGPGYTMQVRGNLAPLTWGNDTGGQLTRIGGDYWSFTGQFRTGDTIRFKFFAGAGGWEQGVVPVPPTLPGDPNRGYIVAPRDTVLPVQFFNNGPVTNQQYFRPWPVAADSFMTVWFRVNMQGADQARTNGYDDLLNGDSVGVRGGTANLDWGTTAFLTKEPAASNGGLTYDPRFFKSGRVLIRKSRVNVGDTVQYKFVFQNPGTQWEDVPIGGFNGNRFFKVPAAKKDTTLYFSYYSNVKPSGRLNNDTVIVNYSVDMTRALNSGGFAPGDTVEVETGHFGTINGSVRTKRIRQNIGSSYVATDTVVTKKGETLDYQFYLNKNGVRTRENYYNFFFNGAIPSEAERRQVIVPTGAGRISMTVRDTATASTAARRQPDFPNPRRLLRTVDVKWVVDIRPAYYQTKIGRDTLRDIQGTFDVTPATADSVYRWGIRINGPATNGWQTWGFPLLNDLGRTMWDDGPAGGHGDLVAGDSLFTRQIIANPAFPPDSGSRFQVGQIFKFGIRGGDNEGGRGGFGNNHSANINDAAGTFTITDQFGSINPRFYRCWDYDNRRSRIPCATGVIEVPGTLPLQYSMDQNYPNPFNPVTNFQYTLAAEGPVSLKVYNMIGQEVATLVNYTQKAGTYRAAFDGAGFASGVYFYKLTAGNFTATKKMMLLK